MIGVVGGKRTSGKSSFSDLEKYIKNKPSDRVLFSGEQNILYTDNPALEMTSVAAQNTRCKDPVMHLILSWREKEVPSEEQVREAVDVTLKEMGLSECQAVWAGHDDTQNFHVHIAVNRVHPETFRAINAAGGYTYKAIQRASREIEFTQGWEPEQSGTYYVTAEGKIIKKSDRGEADSVSKVAGDIEAHTGGKSAERIAKELAAPIIRNAASWEQLHKELAFEGIGLEKKGSGAILSIGEAYVKASTAGRDISLSQLIKKLGAYEPRREDVQIGKRKPEASAKVEKGNAKDEWQRYLDLRKTYYADKKDASEELYRRHKEEYKELRAGHKDENKALYAVSWKGRGAELNVRRSMNAGEHARGKLDLRDRQKRERQEFRQTYGDKFPSFKKWLENEDRHKATEYRYLGQAATMYGTGDDGDFSKNDLRSLMAKQIHKGRVIYTKPDENQAQFIDYGKKLIIYNSQEDRAVLGALQLAQEKWGSVHIDGDDDYKKRCVRLAREHGIKLSNFDTGRDVIAPRADKSALNAEQENAGRNSERGEVDPMGSSRRQQKTDV